VAANLGEIADRLFRGFMAPLVLGGPMHPGRPIGARAALAIGEQRVAGDPDLVSHVELGRVRRARDLAPVDRLGPATPAEWALAAALHDVVQSTHPGFDAALRRRAPARLLDLVDATIERVPPPPSVGDALSRHTWLARTLEIARTDTAVSWWVGSRTFLGVDPPARLQAWPELRRVNVVRTPHPLLELAGSGGSVDAARLAATVARFLARTPLTDVATCARRAPEFAWSAETIAFVGTQGGRTLALRALDREAADGSSAATPRRGQHQEAVDAALGHATRELLIRRQWRAAEVALTILAERAIAEALGVSARSRRGSATAGADAGFARGAGALAARRAIESGQRIFPDEERPRLLAALASAAASQGARELESILAAAGAAPRNAPAQA
jgi:hypothetical protein